MPLHDFSLYRAARKDQPHAEAPPCLGLPPVNCTALPCRDAANEPLLQLNMLLQKEACKRFLALPLALQLNVFNVFMLGEGKHLLHDDDPGFTKMHSQSVGLHHDIF